MITDILPIHVSRLTRIMVGLIELSLFFNSNRIVYSQIKANDVGIPIPIKKYISNNLSEYRLPSISDFVGSLDIYEWKQLHPSSDQPFYCCSDFDGNGFVDYAIILKHGRAHSVLVVFNKYKNGYKHFIVEAFDNIDGKIQAILQVEKKRKLYTVDGPLKLSNDAIEVNLFESSLSYDYYWRRGKYYKIYFD